LTAPAIVTLARRGERISITVTPAEAA